MVIYRCFNAPAEQKSAGALKRGQQELRRGTLAALYLRTLSLRLALEGGGSLEGHRGGSGDLDGFARAGVAAHAGGALLGLEGTETDKLNLLLGNGLGDSGKGGVESGGSALGGGFFAELLTDGIDKLSLVHNQMVTRGKPRGGIVSIRSTVGKP